MPAPYTIRYADAARRLVKDGMILWTNGAYETAGHLAGLSAECVLKALLAGLGVITLDAMGQAPRNYRVHIREDAANRAQLWSEFYGSLTGHAGRAWLALLPPSTPAPFDASLCRRPSDSHG